MRYATPEQKIATLRELHPQEQCEDNDCLICGTLSCPYGEPLHYDKDGCPACTEERRSRTGGEERET